MKAMHVDDIVPDLTTEPPFDIRSFDSELAGGEHFNLGRTLIPPASRNQPHTHRDYELAFYVVKGHVKLFIGPHREEHEARTGHFVYVPKGELHGVENLSTSEAAELVYTYGGSRSRKETWKTTSVT